MTQSPHRSLTRSSLPAVVHHALAPGSSELRTVPCSGGHPPTDGCLRRVEDSLGSATILAHGVVGKGLNDCPRIFATLCASRVDGWIAFEDSVNGLGESAVFLRRRMLS